MMDGILLLLAVFVEEDYKGKSLVYRLDDPLGWLK
jgi:hypothetical protein